MPFCVCAASVSWNFFAQTWLHAFNKLCSPHTPSNSQDIFEFPATFIDTATSAGNPSCSTGFMNIPSGVFLTKEKLMIRHAHLHIPHILYSKKQQNLLFYLRVLGLMEASLIAVPYAQIHSRLFQRNILEDKKSQSSDLRMESHEVSPGVSKVFPVSAGMS